VSEFTGKDLKFHEAANIFPLLDERSFDGLVDDIRENGLREPIKIFDGLVLDGRNRYRACLQAGVKPKFEHVKPSDTISYVLSLNLHRRHLDTSQRSMVAAKMATLKNGANQYKKEDSSKPKEEGTQICAPSIEEAAKALNVSPRSVNQAKQIIAQATPEVVKAIEDGKLTVCAATTEIKRESKRKELQTKKTDVVAKQVDWKLVNKDVIDGLKDIDAKARLIFTDPPYNIGIEYGDHHNDSMEDSKFVSWCLSWMKSCTEKLTDDGSLWVMINDEFAADFVMNLRECGLHMRGWIKWYETFGVNCSNNFNRTSRHILYFVKNPKKFVFNETEVLRPSDRQTKYNDSRAQSSGKIEDDVWQIPRLSGTCEERIPDFPTQLPLELVLRIVAVASEPGDLVLDPFNGSGTTGVASKRLHRKYIGIDASSKFISFAKARLENEV
jgi:DNA modification methylase